MSITPISFIVTNLLKTRDKTTLLKGFITHTLRTFEEGRGR
jgi:hypothetical protein